MGAIRVLVADDDPAMSSLLREQLTYWGYEAASAQDVPSALRLLDAGPYQFVVSDLHMPPGSGFDLLGAIRARWPETAVILMSAFPAPETAQRAREAGALTLLAKPFSMDELREALGQDAPGHCSGTDAS